MKSVPEGDLRTLVEYAEIASVGDFAAVARLRGLLDAAPDEPTRLSNDLEALTANGVRHVLPVQLDDDTGALETDHDPAAHRPLPSAPAPVDAHSGEPVTELDRGAEVVLEGHVKIETYGWDTASVDAAPSSDDEPMASYQLAEFINESVGSWSESCTTADRLIAAGWAVPVAAPAEQGDTAEYVRQCRHCYHDHADSPDDCCADCSYEEWVGYPVTVECQCPCDGWDPVFVRAHTGGPE